MSSSRDRFGTKTSTKLENEVSFGSFSVISGNPGSIAVTGFRRGDLMADLLASPYRDPTRSLGRRCSLLQVQAVSYTVETLRLFACQQRRKGRPAGQLRFQTKLQESSELCTHLIPHYCVHPVAFLDGLIASPVLFRISQVDPPSESVGAD